MEQRVKVDSGVISPKMTGIMIIVRPVLVNRLETSQGLKSTGRTEDSGVVVDPKNIGRGGLRRSKTGNGSRFR